ncbi:carbohydrate porin [Psychromonas sp. KJ10-10]|uniref:carbohydrate porin n=1 Tax=Psychromonas sp. KJ10-10 TaxID=3391823 RepID=UPI0039B45247
MKLSKITLACLLATSGVSISSLANAEITQEYEFGGYVRTGLYYSVENDYKSINGGGQKETLGRLGLEFDDDASLNVGSLWSFDNGNEIRVTASIDDDASLGYSLEMTGITPSGTLWGGDTGYGKDNYIFMTDFFYTDMSGTGIGIKGIEVGDLLIDTAYIASNRDDDDYDLDDSSFANNDNLDNYLHTFNVAVTYNSWEVSLSGKAMVDNWDEDGTEYAETGADITVIYTLDDFFWTGSGQGTIIAQAGVGLGFW